jgi:hypothetical protein
MKRLRHPIRAIREPFGTAGLIVAVLALVLALGGGAFAATSALTGKQKREVVPIVKRYAGTHGSQGPAGPAGAKGDAGPTGQRGERGEVGKPGEAAKAHAGQGPQIIEEYAVGDEGCGGNGGYLYEVLGFGEPAPICNGKEGKDGKEGSPWTAGGKLPPGSTETGAWSTGNGTGEARAAISFPIPLNTKIIGHHIHIAGEPTFNSICSVSGHNTRTPGAPPGEVCIYKGAAEEASAPYVTALDGSLGFDEETEEEVNLVSVAGGILVWNLGGGGYASGSYAVTGCSEEEGAQFPCP